MTERALPQPLKKAFLRQKQACDSLGSAFTALLCGTIAERGLPESRAFQALSDWPGDPSANGDSVPLRLCGALHELVLSSRDASLAQLYPPNHADIDAANLHSAVRAAIKRHDEWICERLRNAPQTNEIRRAAAIYAALLHIGAIAARPVVLSELGSSAGLNLLLDDFSYRFAGRQYGMPGSIVHLEPDWSGPPPPAADISIAERRGCDLRPFDLTDDTDRLRLLSYVWADQTDRIDRLRAALALQEKRSMSVDAADAVEWLDARLREPMDGHAHVVFHTIAWQYLPESRRRRGQSLIEAAGARATPDAPLYRVGLEADGRSPGAALTLQGWPGGIERELARVDFHGRWIQWDKDSHSILRNEI
ncbi:DUF2332 domain-containing protein [Hoeflea poritis]|uniref:DUF2332 family protein n=1 Tax=Hoeflea poritis TaxID=2993659 RepID=A0ABT4VI86_9HYPH|nr:DUF2332 family protein [Hoeflea poritis]MDA4844329.1 DUF2332 family protein [Hoeflea poritis]